MFSVVEKMIEVKEETKEETQTQNSGAMRRIENKPSQDLRLQGRRNPRRSQGEKATLNFLTKTMKEEKKSSFEPLSPLVCWGELEEEKNKP